MTGRPTVTDPRQGPARENAGEVVRVAFQGELGAYGDQAILERWKGNATAIPVVSFEDVVTEVAAGLADYGVVPVWNTVVGDVASGCAAVEQGRRAPSHLVVTGDVHVVVRHHLLVLPGTRLEDVTSAASHPVALAQCGRFLAEHPRIMSNPVYDTAGAARDLALNGPRTSSAVAGNLAAERYRLDVLMEDIQDVPDNVTHFLVLARAAYQGIAPAEVQSNGVVRW
jgi:prephenate dehydratase